MKKIELIDLAAPIGQPSGEMSFIDFAYPGESYTYSFSLEEHIEHYDFKCDENNSSFFSAHRVLDGLDK
jgi:hypothetical protein